MVRNAVEYVKKENVKGKKINCIDFELIDDTIEEKVDEKEFGRVLGHLEKMMDPR